MATTVMGTLNVYLAAVEAGVQRVVFMSSGSTMCGHEWDQNLPYGKLARGEYDQVALVETGRLLVEILEPGLDAGDLAFLLVEALYHIQGAGREFGDGCQVLF